MDNKVRAVERNVVRVGLVGHFERNGTGNHGFVKVDLQVQPSAVDDKIAVVGQCGRIALRGHVGTSEHEMVSIKALLEDFSKYQCSRTAPTCKIERRDWDRFWGRTGRCHRKRRVKPGVGN